MESSTEPEPGIAEDSLAVLGKQKIQFKPSSSELIAGTIIGILMTGSGATLVFFPVRSFGRSNYALPFFAEHGESVFSVGLLVLLGVAAFVGGIALVLWMRSLLSFRVVVCENDFYVGRRDKREIYTWDKIVSVRETVLTQHIPIVKGVARRAMPTTMNHSYVVLRSDGEEFAFNGTTVKGVKGLAGIIRRHTSKYEVPWEVVEEHD
jgi:hypothetical protein